MFIHTTDRDSLAKHIRKEVVFDGEVERGDRTKAARRVQEWLRFHGLKAVKVDGQFGRVTEEAVASFQQTNDLAPSGVVDESTFDLLVAPMLQVLRAPTGPVASYGDAVAAFAEQHLTVRPVELGGANRGPWVRLYHRGGHGKKFLWCAGFVTFCMQQAAEFCGVDMPIDGSMSCDQLSRQAKEAGLFLSEDEALPETISRGSLFLRRKAPGDWNHVGVVTATSQESFSTVEGNTNGRGSRNGDRVAAHALDYRRMDFVVL